VLRYRAGVELKLCAMPRGSLRRAGMIQAVGLNNGTHPRSAQYRRARKKQILINLSINEAMTIVSRSEPCAFAGINAQVLPSTSHLLGSSDGLNSIYQLSIINYQFINLSMNCVAFLQQCRVLTTITS
jgi:hypothetical protein